MTDKNLLTGPIRENKKLEELKSKLIETLKKLDEEFAQSPAGQLHSYLDQLSRHVADKRQRAEVAKDLIERHKEYIKHIEQLEGPVKEAKVSDKGKKDITKALEGFEKYHPEEVEFFLRIAQAIRARLQQIKGIDLSHQDIVTFVDNFEEFVKFMETKTKDQRLIEGLAKIYVRLDEYKHIRNFAERALELIAKDSGEWEYFRGVNKWEGKGYPDELARLSKIIKYDKEYIRKLKVFLDNKGNRKLTIRMLTEMSKELHASARMFKLEDEHLHLLDEVIKKRVAELNKEVVGSMKNLFDALSTRLRVLDEIKNKERKALKKAEKKLNKAADELENATGSVVEKTSAFIQYAKRAAEIFNELLKVVQGSIKLFRAFNTYVSGEISIEGNKQWRDTLLKAKAAAEHVLGMESEFDSNMAEIEKNRPSKHEIEELRRKAKDAENTARRNEKQVAEVTGRTQEAIEGEVNTAAADAARVVEQETERLESAGNQQLRRAA